ncbi:hypothetical protein EP7_003225 [Isosphaeraceae bacterium EP7]
MSALMLLAISTLGAAPAADQVTLRDGVVVPGVIIQVSPRGGPTLIVERGWAKANAPKWLEGWERAEAPSTLAASKQRRKRLDDWAAERHSAGADDAISNWIEAQRARADNSAAQSPLLVARILRGDIRTIARAPIASTRLLKLAWSSGIHDAASLDADQLKQALEGRGVSATRMAEPNLSALLPPQTESDAEWLARRAATEVANDDGLRYLRHGEILLPEPAAGEMPSPLEGLSSVTGALKSLLSDVAPVDPLPAKLREAEARGRVGVLVTKLDVAPDNSGVQVQATLWARLGPENWHQVATRQASGRPGAGGAGDGADLLADPQVKAVFGIVESLNLGGIPDELKRTSLGIGAATRQALGSARAEIQGDLDRLALPVRERSPDQAPAASPDAPAASPAAP